MRKTLFFGLLLVLLFSKATYATPLVTVYDVGDTLINSSTAYNLTVPVKRINSTGDSLTVTANISLTSGSVSVSDYIAGSFTKLSVSGALSVGKIQMMASSMNMFNIYITGTVSNQASISAGEIDIFGRICLNTNAKLVADTTKISGNAFNISDATYPISTGIFLANNSSFQGVSLSIEAGANNRVNITSTNTLYNVAAGIYADKSSLNLTGRLSITATNGNSALGNTGSNYMYIGVSVGVHASNSSINTESILISGKDNNISKINFSFDSVKELVINCGLGISLMNSSLITGSLDILAGNSNYAYIYPDYSFSTINKAEVGTGVGIYAADSTISCGPISIIAGNSNMSKAYFDSASTAFLSSGAGVGLTLNSSIINASSITIDVGKSNNSYAYASYVDTINIHAGVGVGLLLQKNSVLNLTGVLSITATDSNFVNGYTDNFGSAEVSADVGVGLAVLTNSNLTGKDIFIRAGSKNYASAGYLVFTAIGNSIANVAVGIYASGNSVLDINDLNIVAANENNASAGGYTNIKPTANTAFASAKTGVGFVVENNSTLNTKNITIIALNTNGSKTQMSNNGVNNGYVTFSGVGVGALLSSAKVDSGTNTFSISAGDNNYADTLSYFDGYSGVGVGIHASNNSEITAGFLNITAGNGNYAFASTNSGAIAQAGVGIYASNSKVNAANGINILAGSNNKAFAISSNSTKSGSFVGVGVGIFATNQSVFQLGDVSVIGVNGNNANVNYSHISSSAGAGVGLFINNKTDFTANNLRVIAQNANFVNNYCYTSNLTGFAALSGVGVGLFANDNSVVKLANVEISAGSSNYCITYLPYNRAAFSGGGVGLVALNKSSITTNDLKIEAVNSNYSKASTYLITENHAVIAGVGVGLAAIDSSTITSNNLTIKAGSLNYVSHAYTDSSFANISGTGVGILVLNDSALIAKNISIEAMDSNRSASVFKTEKNYSSTATAYAGVGIAVINSTKFKSNNISITAGSANCASASTAKSTLAGVGVGIYFSNVLSAEIGNIYIKADDNNYAESLSLTSSATCSAGAGVGIALLNNLNLIAKNVNIEANNENYVEIFPAANSVVGVGVGLFATDKVKAVLNDISISANSDNYANSDSYGGLGVGIFLEKEANVSARNITIKALDSNWGTFAGVGIYVGNTAFLSVNNVYIEAQDGNESWITDTSVAVGMRMSADAKVSFRNLSIVSGSNNISDSSSGIAVGLFIPTLSQTASLTFNNLFIQAKDNNEAMDIGVGMYFGVSNKLDVKNVTIEAGSSNWSKANISLGVGLLLGTKSYLTVRDISVIADSNNKSFGVIGVSVGVLTGDEAILDGYNVNIEASNNNIAVNVAVGMLLSSKNNINLRNITVRSGSSNIATSSYSIGTGIVLRENSVFNANNITIEAMDNNTGKTAGVGLVLCDDSVNNTRNIFVNVGSNNIGDDIGAGILISNRASLNAGKVGITAQNSNASSASKGISVGIILSNSTLLNCLDIDISAGNENSGADIGVGISLLSGSNLHATSVNITAGSDGSITTGLGVKTGVFLDRSSFEAGTISISSAGTSTDTVLDTGISLYHGSEVKASKIYIDALGTNNGIHALLNSTLKADYIAIMDTGFISAEVDSLIDVKDILFGENITLMTDVSSQINISLNAAVRPLTKGSIVVDSTAVLKGNGSAMTPVLYNFGKIDIMRLDNPETSGTTIYLTGNYVQDGGTINTLLSAGNQTNKITLTGNAEFKANSKVHLAIYDPDFITTPDDIYIFLSAASAIGIENITATYSGPILKGKRLIVGEENGNVYLRFIYLKLSDFTVDLNVNALNLYNELCKVEPPIGLQLEDVIYTLAGLMTHENGNAILRESLNSMTGELYAEAIHLRYEHLSYYAFDMINKSQVANRFSTSLAVQSKSLKYDGNAIDFDSSFIGVLSNYTKKAKDNYYGLSASFGVIKGYEGRDDIRVFDLQTGVSANLKMGPFRLEGFIGLGISFSTLNREIMIYDKDTYYYTVTSKFKTYYVNSDIVFSYDPGSNLFIPYVGVEAEKIVRGEIKEDTGHPTDLTIAKNIDHNILLKTGLKFRYRFESGTFGVNVAYKRLIGPTSTGIDVKMNEIGFFDVYGVDKGADVISATFSLESRVSQNVYGSMFYNFEYRNHSIVNTLAVNITLEF